MAAILIAAALAAGCGADAANQPLASPVDKREAELDAKAQEFRETFEAEHGPVKPRAPDELFPWDDDFSPTGQRPRHPRKPPKDKAAAQSSTDEAREIELMLDLGKKPKSGCETLCCF